MPLPYADMALATIVQQTINASVDIAIALQ